MTFTKALVYAASKDAQARALRSGQSKAKADDAYYTEFNRLFALLGGVEGWIDLQ